MQERVVRTQTSIMVAKNQEIEEAVEDLLELIGDFLATLTLAPKPDP